MRRRYRARARLRIKSYHQSQQSESDCCDCLVRFVYTPFSLARRVLTTPGKVDAGKMVTQGLAGSLLEPAAFLLHELRDALRKAAATEKVRESFPWRPVLDYLRQSGAHSCAPQGLFRRRQEQRSARDGVHGPTPRDDTSGQRGSACGEACSPREEHATHEKLPRLA